MGSIPLSLYTACDAYGSCRRYEMSSRISRGHINEALGATSVDVIERKAAINHDSDVT